MKLTETERNTLVKYRLERANDTLLDVELAIQNMRWHNAANRLYYACYYAAVALLLKDGHVVHTHNGVKSLLGLHYINEGKIDENLMKAYRRMFNLRQTGDYDDLAEITEDEILDLVEPAKRFILTVENLMHNNNMNQ
jgi:uncharacterized protein (UPF0332 family)